MLTYVDSSVVLAHILAEDRQPPWPLWEQTLVSSSLLEYEVWVRLHSLGIVDTHGEMAERLVGAADLLDMSAPVLERALKPFPAPLRTLDALHVASMDYLRGSGQQVELASYDRRMRTAAELMGFPLYDLGD